MTERLQKLMAAAGLCSRRTAEQWLEAGRVRVNGEPARLGQKADPDHDRIEVDGKPLHIRPQLVYLMLHKPRGYVTTLSDELGRKTAAELVADCGVRVFPVGRLDKDSEGLLLFTNDGDLMQELIHPRYEIEKVYRVTVSGRLPGAAERLAAVDRLEDGPILPAKVTVLEEKADRTVLQVIICQGKNRQIRRMCQSVDLNVLRLQRVQEHTLSLGNLKAGKWRYLTETEVQQLKGGR
ncbi:MAG: rRNA pseudouridine synthase [Ruminococcaceae bacterium]|nr:rRNA pseudouridine synthase [Oscillospiraceae bacterium]